jgi:hypothetical protein
MRRSRRLIYAYRVSRPELISRSDSRPTRTEVRFELEIECLEDFLGSLLTLSISSAEASPYYWVSTKPADLPASPIPTPFNPHIRQGAELSLLLLSIA